MRRLLAVAALLVTLQANAAPVTGWVGVPLIADDGASSSVAVPDVVGEADSAAADTILEGDGLDLGSVFERCSAEADNEIIGQNPDAGTLVALGSLVYVTASNGTECSGRPRTRLGLGLE